MAYFPTEAILNCSVTCEDEQNSSPGICSPGRTAVSGAICASPELPSMPSFHCLKVRYLFGGRWGEVLSWVGVVWRAFYCKIMQLLP